MSSTWGFKQIVIALFALIIIGSLVFFLYNETKDPISIIKNWSFGPKQLNYTIEDYSAVYENIYSNYQKCKQSNAVGCYCNLGLEKLPEDTTLELTNENQVTAFRMFKGGVQESGYMPDNAQTIDSSLPLLRLEIQNDRTYLPPLILSSEPRYSSKILISKTTKTLLGESSGLTLFSAEDVSGRNMINFQNGVIYKENAVNTIFMQSSENLKECRTNSISKAQLQNPSEL